MDHTTDWPQGVLLRALNRYGARIDVTALYAGRHRATCNACNRSIEQYVVPGEEINLKLLKWVDDHANTRRFLPRPS